MDRELMLALKKFREQYPWISTGDMQTFVLAFTAGWEARQKEIEYTEAITV
jgi:hypothetical protein